MRYIEVSHPTEHFDLIIGYEHDGKIESVVCADTSEDVSLSNADFLLVQQTIDEELTEN